MTQWHYLNILTQLVFDAVLVKTAGVRPLIYLLMSSFFAGSLHPCAGHFIAENYLWDGLEQETYSYYGPLNILAYNVRHVHLLSPWTSSHIMPCLCWISQRASRLPVRALDTAAGAARPGSGVLRHHPGASLMADGHHQLHP